MLGRAHTAAIFALLSLWSSSPIADEVDFDFARRVVFTPKDVPDIYRISRQNQRDPWRICPNTGLLVTTNVLVERLDEDAAKFTSTNICLKYRKGKRYLLNRVTHNVEEGEISYLEYLFKDRR